MSPPIPERTSGQAVLGCPFPPEADASKVDQARVALQVDVRADGTPVNGRVLADPGFGFGREALRCAMAQCYRPALDATGNAIASSLTFRIVFSR